MLPAMRIPPLLEVDASPFTVDFLQALQMSAVLFQLFGLTRTEHDQYLLREDFRPFKLGQEPLDDFAEPAIKSTP